jgi:hypothetical protein
MELPSFGRSATPDPADYASNTVLISGILTLIPGAPFRIGEKHVTPTDPVQQLLGSLYAAPMHPQRWSAFLEQLSVLTGLRKAALITHDTRRNEHKILATIGDSLQGHNGAYEGHYCQHDEWTLKFPSSGFSGRVVRGEEIIRCNSGRARGSQYLSRSPG